MFKEWIHKTKIDLVIGVLGAGRVADTPHSSAVSELREAASVRLVELLLKRHVGEGKEGKELLGHAKDFLDHDGVLGAIVFEGVDGTSEFDDARMPRLGMLSVLADGIAAMHMEGVSPIIILRIASTHGSVVGGRPNRFWHTDFLDYWKVNKGGI